MTSAVQGEWWNCAARNVREALLYERDTKLWLAARARYALPVGSETKRRADWYRCETTTSWLFALRALLEAWR